MLHLASQVSPRCSLIKIIVSCDVLRGLGSHQRVSYVYDCRHLADSGGLHHHRGGGETESTRLITDTPSLRLLSAACSLTSSSPTQSWWRRDRPGRKLFFTWCKLSATLTVLSLTIPNVQVVAAPVFLVSRPVDSDRLRGHLRYWSLLRDANGRQEVSSCCPPSGQWNTSVRYLWHVGHYNSRCGGGGLVTLVIHNQIKALTRGPIRLIL